MIHPFVNFSQGIDQDVFGKWVFKRYTANVEMSRLKLTKLMKQTKPHLQLDYNRMPYLLSGPVARDAQTSLIS